MIAWRESLPATWALSTNGSKIPRENTAAVTIPKRAFIIRVFFKVDVLPSGPFLIISNADADSCLFGGFAVVDISDLTTGHRKMSRPYWSFSDGPNSLSDRWR